MNKLTTTLVKLALILAIPSISGVVYAKITENDFEKHINKIEIALKKDDIETSWRLFSKAMNLPGMQKYLETSAQESTSDISIQLLSKPFKYAKPYLVEKPEYDGLHITIIDSINILASTEQIRQIKNTITRNCDISTMPFCKKILNKMIVLHNHITDELKLERQKDLAALPKDKNSLGKSCPVLDVTGVYKRDELLKFVMKLQNAADRMDRKELANYVMYPLQVNLSSSKHIEILDSKMLSKKLNFVFPNYIMDSLRFQKFTDLFCRDQGVAIGNGNAWINEGPNGKLRIYVINLNQKQF